ncbi:MAG TPA: methylated-DNA--[protein]-cysteine S-methyltransferase [Stellaceae bacterium]|jgi:methylated-DNA-[protein]-cysteine S-methyltransferase|nr:methylated-DNA--[protein]-cysteine S-methyltransferase [Stellaceae bacterium]
MPSISTSTPVGHLTIDERDGAIVAIRWADDTAGSNGSALLNDAVGQLQEYFAGRRMRFDLPLAAAGTSFEKRVWAAMSAIPFGETRTYGDLAHDLDSGPRAIGRACGRNPIPIVVPCHRILARHGIGGFSGGTGLPTKELLLSLEGVMLKAA